jgi:hypothetical protein
MTAKVSSLFRYFCHPDPIKNGVMAKQKWPPSSEKLNFFNFRYFFDLFNHTLLLIWYFSIIGNRMRLILLFFSLRFDKNWPIYNIFQDFVISVTEPGVIEKYIRHRGALRYASLFSVFFSKLLFGYWIESQVYAAWKWPVEHRRMKILNTICLYC